MNIEKCLDGLNSKSFELLSIAISKGSKMKSKPLVSARYGEKDWVDAIRKKQWDKISKMYNGTQIKVMMKLFAYLKNNGIVQNEI